MKFYVLNTKNILRNTNASNTSQRIYESMSVLTGSWNQQV